MARRTTKQAEETRQAILEAARKLFAEQGFDASIASIVSAAGVTKGALFHHFTNKQALYFEVWRDLQIQMDLAAREAAEAAASSEDPYAAFLAGCRTYLNWAVRPDYQRIVLVDGPTALGLAGWYEADNDLGQQNVRKGIAYLVERGLIAPQRLKTTAVLFQATLNGAGFALGRKEEGLTVDSVMEAFEVMLRNMR